MKKKTFFFWLFFTGFLFLFFGENAFSGGNFKDKYQQKINAPSNIQFNNRMDVDSMQVDEQTGRNEELSEDSNRKPRRAGEDKRIERSVLVPAPEKEKSAVIPYAIYKSGYTAELEDDVVNLKGAILLEVFNKGRISIPLADSNVGLIDVTVNRGSSFVVMQSGKYYLVLDKPGRYNLEIEFLIKASREREGGPGSFFVNVIPAPIAQFEFTMAETDVQIFVEPSIKTELKRETNKTSAWAIMPNTNSVTVRWTKALPKENIPQVKLEPKVFVDTATYASVGEGVVRCQAVLNYSILQSEISNMRVALPEDVSVLDVNGRDLRDWKVTKNEGKQYLDVYLNFGIKGSYGLNLTFERNIAEGSTVTEIPWVRSIGVEREKGYFGIAANSNVELAVNKVDRATLIDVKELPPSIWGSSVNPILLAFKYLAQPYTITVEVTKHQEVPVLVAAIDSVNYVSLLTDEGKNLTKATYQIRNNVKQFIRIKLPANSILWSAFVGNRPVKPAKDKNGNILIPLEKSQLQGESLTQFPVEIVYLDKIIKMKLMGKFRFNLPETDIPVSELYWSIYAPVDYKYFNFQGDVKAVKYESHGWGVLGALDQTVTMSKKKSYSMPSASIGGKLESQYASAEQQAFQEVETARARGVLPIRMNIPEQGKLLRFYKLLVEENEYPWLEANYLKFPKQLGAIFRGLFWIILLVCIGLWIKKLTKKP